MAFSAPPVDAGCGGRREDAAEVRGSQLQLRHQTGSCDWRGKKKEKKKKRNPTSFRACVCQQGHAWLV